MYSICQADKSWNVTNVDDCECKFILVFCYQNCSDLLREKCEKNGSSNREKLLKFEAEGKNFEITIEQFIQTMKGQNNFW